MLPVIQRLKVASEDSSNKVLKEHKRHWETTHHLLEENRLAMLNKKNSKEIHNVLKVWRIREVPDFYGLYFLYFISSLPIEQQNNLISRQIEETLASKSFYFTIRQKKQQRDEAVAHLRHLLTILEGFENMNQNRPDPKGEDLIKDILSECTTLDQIKQAEEQKYREFSDCIKRLRRSTYELMSLIEQWRTSLATINNVDMFDRLNKLRIMYIQKDINILVLILYDTAFVAKSFLHKWVNFSEKNDPFFIEILKEKPENPTQSLILQDLKNVQNSQAVLKMVYKLTQQLNTKDIILPSARGSQNSSKRPSKDSIKSQTPKSHIRGMLKQELSKRKDEKAVTAQPMRGQLNIYSNRNKIQIIYSGKKKMVTEKATKQISPKNKQQKIMGNQSRHSRVSSSGPVSRDVMQIYGGTSHSTRKNSKDILAGYGSAKSIDEEAIAEEQTKRLDLKRLSIERDKLQRQLEKQKKKQKKQAEEYAKKFQKLDKQLEKFKEQKKFREQQAKQLKKLNKSIEVPKPEAKGQTKDKTKIYKNMVSSKGFASRKSNEEEEKLRLAKELETQRKKQSKEVIEYTKKLQKYDDQLAKVKLQRDIQKVHLQQIEKQKQAKIKEKEAQLLALKKYMKEELKKKEATTIVPVVPISFHQYKSKSNTSQGPSEIQKQHELQRLNLRKRIEDIYNSASSKSKYSSVVRDDSSVQSTSRVKSIEIVYNTKNHELRALAKKIKRADKEIIELRNREIVIKDHSTIEEEPRNNEKNPSKIYGTKASRVIDNNTRRMKQLEKQKLQLKLQKQKRQQALLIQKKALVKEYDQKIDLERKKYKKQMEALSQALKKRELDMISQIRNELLEQKQLRQERQKKLEQELQYRRQIEKQKAQIQQQKERLAMEIETKRLKEELERQIRDELMAINDLKKEEEEAQEMRKLKQEAIRIQMIELEKKQNEQIVRMDLQNDELRKVLLSRKKRLFKVKTEESEGLLPAENQFNKTHYRAMTQVVEEKIRARSALGARPATEMKRLSTFEPSQVSQLFKPDAVEKSHKSGSLIAQLNEKAIMQRALTQQLFRKYHQVQALPERAQNDEIEGLINMYRKSITLSRAQSAKKTQVMQQKKKSDQFLAAAITNQNKKQIIDDIMNNRGARQQFEKQLQEKGKGMRNLLNQASQEVYYKNFMDLRMEAENNALLDWRQQNRYALNQNDQCADEQLSTSQKPEPPPRTIREHILLHQKQLDETYKQSQQKKNFFKINKEKLKHRQIEDTSKEKKPVKISEQVLKRRDESLKKFIGRTKGVSSSKEFKTHIGKKQQSNQKREVKKDTVKHKETEKIHKSSKQKNEQQKQQKQQQKHGQQKHEQKHQQQKHDYKQSSIPKSSQLQSPEKPKEPVREPPFQPVRQLTQQSMHLDISRIPTQLSQKQRTQQSQQPQLQPMKELQDSIRQSQRELEQKQRQEREEEQRIKKQQQEAERLKDIEEQKRQQKIVKYRGVIKEMLNMANYSVYQEVIDQKNLKKYLEEYERMSSADTIKINKFDIDQALKFAQTESSYHILIAKDSKKLQKGIGLFRKNQNAYLCDHLTTHQLNTLTQLALSFTYQIFQWDAGCQRIEFQFVFDNADIQHANIYQSFEQLCMDYGEVYQLRGDTLKRKYVIRRNLFVDEKRVVASIPEHNEMTASFQVDLIIAPVNSLRLRKKYEKDYESTELTDQSPVEISTQIMLTQQIKSILSMTELEALKEKIKHNIRLKELMLTTVSMEKKGLTVEEVKKQKINKIEILAQNIPEIASYFEKSEAALNVSSLREVYPLTAKIKICRLTIEQQPISYIGIEVGAPTVCATSTSYNTPCSFLALSKSHKLLFMDAGQFLALCQTNPELDIFFYLKHYIKNIKQLTKEEFPIVYLPRVNSRKMYYHQEMSKILERQLFSYDRLHFGDYRMASSIRMEPNHRDLVIKPPFIMCILSAKLERANSGTPIYARLVNVQDIM